MTNGLRGVNTSTRVLRALLLFFGCAAVAVVTACSASVSVGDADKVTKPDDVSIGECVSIGESSDDGKVEAKKAECSADGLTFYAAATAPADQQCANENYSHLTFDGSPDRLCLTPNFTQGQCYQIPAGENASLSDYKELECGAAPIAQSVAYQVTTRTEGEATCPPGQVAVSFEQPKPVGFCLTKESQA